MNKKEQEVLDKNSARDSYIYCYNNEDANINLHEDIIIKVNNAYYIYRFAFDIKGFDVEWDNLNKLEDAIIKSNDAVYIYHFAKYLNNSDKDKLFKGLLELNNLYYINLFLTEIDFDKERYEDLLLFL